MLERRASTGAALSLGAPLLLLAATLLQGCESTVVTPVQIEEVEVVPPELVLVEGDRGTLTATIRGESGEELGRGQATWTVDDASVASVTSEGVVDALSAGATLIRASVGDVSGTAALSVLLGPTLQLSTHSLSFETTADDDEPRTAEIDIRNAGAGALEGLEVRAEESGGGNVSWISAELSAPAAPALLRLHADPGGLAPGDYAALVTVTSTSASDGARIDVSLRVSEADRGGDPSCETGGGFIPGDLRIPKDTRCVVSDVFVAGDLRLDDGASFVGSDITVRGDVDAKNADELTLVDATIFGDFEFRDGGSVILRESRVGGKVELKSNTGSIELHDNVVERDVELERNRGGPFLLVRNEIDGELECRANQPAPSGTGNEAERATGQCRGL